VATGNRTQIAFVQNSRTSAGNFSFAHQRVNLNDFAGKTIQVEFLMDTFDAVANTAEGWYVDNIVVSQLVAATVNLPPTSDLVSPTSGTGASQLFTFSYSDPNGDTDLNGVYALFNSTLSGTNACFVFYVRATNLMYMANDLNTAPLAPVTPGTAATLENSQ